MADFIAWASLSGAPLDARAIKALQSRHSAIFGERPQVNIGLTFAYVLGNGVRSESAHVATQYGRTVVGDFLIDGGPTTKAIGAPVTTPSDILFAHRTGGPTAIAQFIGDFAFGLWCEPDRVLLACRDALGVKPLYFRRQRDVVMLSSRAVALADSEEYDLDALAYHVASTFPPDGQTIFRDVRMVVPGTMLCFSPRGMTAQTYWNAAQFEPELVGDLTEHHVEECRTLFFDALRATTRTAGGLWAELSGGIDSSSIVSGVSWLARDDPAARPLDSTITYVDSLARGDETDFVDAVTAAWQVSNHRLRDYNLWHDDGERAPLTDTPLVGFLFYARDRAIRRIVTSHGGALLLSGVGSDQYLAASNGFFADLIVNGHPIRAIRALAQWSIAYRKSFWRYAYGQAVLQLLPRSWRARRARRRHRPYSWIPSEFVKRYNVADRMPSVRLLAGAPGHQWHQRTASEMNHMTFCIEREPLTDGLAVRYPFLHRPLVEFALRLPIFARVQPYLTKRVLREAMSGITPELVLRRTGKGTIGARMRRSYQQEGARVHALCETPLLAELGCVDSITLAQTVQRAEMGQKQNIVGLTDTLAIETWLRAQAGAWPPGDDSQAAATEQSLVTLA